jgi:hypothetical protein
VGVRPRIDALADETIGPVEPPGVLSDIDQVNAAMATYTTKNDFDPAPVGTFQTAWQQCHDETPAGPRSAELTLVLRSFVPPPTRDTPVARPQPAPTPPSRILKRP